MTQHNESTTKGSIDIISLILAVLFVIVAVVCVNCYITQYENNYKGDVLAAQLKQAQDENDRLMIEYQRRSSYLNVEQYVSANLNLQKLSKYQYEYIDRDTVNVVSISGEDTADEPFTQDIVKAFSVILEYFR